MSLYECGIVVQTKSNLDGIERFAWCIPIMSWHDESIALVRALQAKGIQIDCWRFCEDPTTWDEFGELMEICKAAVFANEPDLEGWPSWYSQAAGAWRNSGGELVEPAWHDEQHRNAYPDPSPEYYDVVTAHCYSGNFDNWHEAIGRAAGRPVVMSEYAHHKSQAQCLQELAAGGIPANKTALFIQQWVGGQAGFDLIGVDLAQPEGEPPVPMDEATQQAMIEMEAKQNQLLTDLIKQIRTGHWTGAGSVDGIYCALKGGIAAPDYTPTFP